ncbi:hypothetical protein Henu3_gp107 [Mycobacterium phage Henu3 PeY-2017]|nr:hypothetical protein Henu3_gp107 [Mycobacterium phage Henu3 PeY-2017]
MIASSNSASISSLLGTFTGSLMLPPLRRGRPLNTSIRNRVDCPVGAHRAGRQRYRSECTERRGLPQHLLTLRMPQTSDCQSRFLPCSRPVHDGHCALGTRLHVHPVGMPLALKVAAAVVCAPHDARYPPEVDLARI